MIWHIGNKLDIKTKRHQKSFLKTSIIVEVPTSGAEIDDALA